MRESFEGQKFIPEKTKNRLEKLEGMLSAMSTEINQELRASIGHDILNNDASINMDSFWTKKGGPYKKEGADDSVKADKEMVRDLELRFSGVKNEDGSINEKALISYEKEYGTTDFDEIIQIHKKNREKQSNHKLEMAITGLLYKVLKSEFVVVRSSLLDDYTAGVDNVIVNKRTGQVVCAFDEVHDQKGGGREKEKINKVSKKAEKGGATIKYGFTFEKDSVSNETKLIRTAIDHIPSFYLGLTPEELEELLNSMEFDISKEVTKVELKIFDILIKSLEEQIDMLENNKKIDEKIRKNIQNFKNSLKQMKDLRAKFNA